MDKHKITMHISACFMEFQNKNKLSFGDLQQVIEEFNRLFGIAYFQSTVNSFTKKYGKHSTNLLVQSLRKQIKECIDCAYRWRCESIINDLLDPERFESDYIDRLNNRTKEEYIADETIGKLLHQNEE